MALFIFLAVVPGRRRWDALRPPDSRSQAGCTAPARAAAAAGWKQGDPFPVAMGRISRQHQPLPSPRRPWAGRATAGGSVVVHGGPRVSGGTRRWPQHPRPPRRAGGHRAWLPQCWPGAPAAAGHGQDRAAPGPPCGAGLRGGFRGPLALI